MYQGPVSNTRHATRSLRSLRCAAPPSPPSRTLPRRPWHCCGTWHPLGAVPPSAVTTSLGTGHGTRASSKWPYCGTDMSHFSGIPARKGGRIAAILAGISEEILPLQSGHGQARAERNYTRLQDPARVLKSCLTLFAPLGSRAKHAAVTLSACGLAARRAINGLGFPAPASGPHTTLHAHDSENRSMAPARHTPHPLRNALVSCPRLAAHQPHPVQP